MSSGNNVRRTPGGRSSEYRYDGAIRCWQRHASTARRYSIFCGARNQRRLRKSEVTWSYFRTEKTSLAAAIMIEWSHVNCRVDDVVDQQELRIRSPTVSTPMSRRAIAVPAWWLTDERCEFGVGLGNMRPHRDIGIDGYAKITNGADWRDHGCADWNWREPRPKFDVGEEMMNTKLPP